MQNELGIIYNEKLFEPAFHNCSFHFHFSLKFCFSKIIFHCKFKLTYKLMLRRTFCALQVDAGRRPRWITPVQPGVSQEPLPDNPVAG
jgi:hypothetical protein